MLKENKDFAPDLVVLPEVFNIGVNHEIFQDMAEPTGAGETTMFLSGFANEFNTYIIGGSFIEKSHDGNFYNTSLAFDRNGKIIGKYRKIHMFSYFGSKEGKYITSGDKTCVIDTDFGKVGMSICYDLRFPEQYRCLVDKGAQIIVCPAAWPTERREHLITLSKARAIENLSYFVLVNQTGKSEKERINAGNSMIINPWGEIISQANQEEGIIKAEIDLSQIQKIRKEFPVLEDRKPQAYQ